MSSLLIGKFWRVAVLIANESTDFSPQDRVSKDARLIHIENHDWNLIVHAQTKRGRVHYLEPLSQSLSITDAVIPFCVRIFVGICIIDAVDLGCFQNYLCP